MAKDSKTMRELFKEQDGPYVPYINKHHDIDKTVVPGRIDQVRDPSSNDRVLNYKLENGDDRTYKIRMTPIEGLSAERRNHFIDSFSDSPEPNFHKYVDSRMEFDRAIEGMDRGELLDIRERMNRLNDATSHITAPHQKEVFNADMEKLDDSIMDREIGITKNLQKHFTKHYDVQPQSLGVKGGNFHFELENGSEFRVHPDNKGFNGFQVQTPDRNNRNWDTMFKINKDDIEPAKHEKVLAMEMER